ncbi:hypothetical protein TRFO_12308 [Tritrichomonas foetus]|uniref:Uncharacterized protein n=1 Tax=Tritrichomonas foetus TaxID=1144522 RepID=A0A1J4J532_9EUKA|nr:hypothetical protein TRFO_12308 [Tritrichomonas foetus]|eukprot:OHS92755.1 hypothetical protein TRFO_12308 [Tritrichomonas foetus]
MLAPDVCCDCKNICVTGERSHRPLSHHIQHSRCHIDNENNSANPVYRIHGSSIKMFNILQVSIRPLNTREVEATCLECGKSIIVYASGKGAFCQFVDDNNDKVRKKSRSFSSEGSIESIGSDLLPKSLQQLFCREIDQFDFSSLDYGLVDNEIEPLPRKSETIRLSDIEEEDDDFDLMFSNSIEPFVGSFCDSGRFTIDANYLNLAD